MTHFLTASSPFRWRASARLAVVFGLLASLVSITVGQEEEETAPKPIKRIGVEEEAPPAAAPKKKIAVDEEPPPMPGAPEAPEAPAAEVEPPKNVVVDRSAELVRAVANARDPAIKQFLQKFVAAHDRLYETGNKVTRITPVPLLWGGGVRFPAGFGVAELDDNDQAKAPRATERTKVRRVEPFERFALTEVEALLQPPMAGAPADTIPRGEKLAAAEAVLTRVLFFHDSAREQEKRRGKAWDYLKGEIYTQLTTVRSARLQQATADRDWAKVKELSTRLSQLYKSNPKVQEQAYAARLGEALDLVQSKRVIDLERGRALLNDYDSRFPNSGNETAQKVRQALADRAKTFMAQAETVFNQDNKTEARNLLKTVEAIDPDNPALRPLQQQLKTGYPVLVVGTRRLPERMSPALARSASEQHAEALMFEGLLDAIPDETVGTRYEPALAADRPLVAAGVRDVSLVRSANWTGGAGGVFDASDVAGTLRLFRQAPNSWAAEPVAWLDEPRFDPTDPGFIRLRFKAGHPDPRSLLTLRLHPAGWLLQQNKRIDDVEFARRPFGTGPFKLAPDFKPRADTDPPRDVVFLSNPAFGRRPGRMGQPFIKEIRFTDTAQFPDPAAEFRADRLHLLADVPTADLPKFQANGNLGGRVKVVTPAVNRRVLILAINHRKPALATPDVRRALSHAIDRERVLNEVFRAGRDEHHKALNGPYPPNTWAIPPGTDAATPLFNRDLAQAKFKEYLAKPEAVQQLDLLYPDDDPLAKSACERIKLMVESATAGDERHLTILPKPTRFRDLLHAVETVHNYDLAYLPFDYPDDWYPLALGAYLDPAAAISGGRNVTGYLSNKPGMKEEDERLSRPLAEARLYRDTVGKLIPLAHEIHRRFNDATPFVPLWQIDRHLVLSTGLKIHLDGQVDEANPRWLDPATLFNSVGRWRLE